MPPKIGLHTGDFGITVLKPHAAVVKPGVPMDLRVRFLDKGPDMTLVDVETATYRKECVVRGVTPEMHVGDVRRMLAEQEGLVPGSFRLFLPPWEMPDDALVSQCYYQLMGYGMERWPPRFIAKNALRGFEVTVEVPKSRATATFDEEVAKFLSGPSGPGGVPEDRPYLTSYAMRSLVYDVQASTTVGEVKRMIEGSIDVPAGRQLLACDVLGEGRVAMEDGGVMSDYGMRQRSVIYFQKNHFDEDGNYVFDDAFFDSEGYHPAPVETPGATTTLWRPG